MTHRNKNIVITALSLLLVIIILLLQKQCSSTNLYKDALDDSHTNLKISRDSNEASIKTITANKDIINSLAQSRDSLTRETAKLTKDLIKSRKNPQIVTKIITEFVYDTLFVTDWMYDTVKKDSFIYLYAYPSREISKDDKWLSYTIRTSKDSVGLNISLVEELDVVHRYKGGLFRKKELITEITSKNPYIKIEDSQSIHVIKGKELRKLTFKDRLGIYGGIGLCLDLNGNVVPCVNVGFGYKIF